MDIFSPPNSVSSPDNSTVWRKRQFPLPGDHLPSHAVLGAHPNKSNLNMWQLRRELKTMQMERTCSGHTAGGEGSTANVADGRKAAICDAAREYPSVSWALSLHVVMDNGHQ